MSITIKQLKSGKVYRAEKMIHGKRLSKTFYTESDAKDWINSFKSKSKSMIAIPVTVESREILNKYMSANDINTISESIISLTEGAPIIDYDGLAEKIANKLIVKIGKRLADIELTMGLITNEEYKDLF